MEGKGALRLPGCSFGDLKHLNGYCPESRESEEMSERAVNAIIKLGLMVKEECEVDGI